MDAARVDAGAGAVGGTADDGERGATGSRCTGCGPAAAGAGGRRRRAALTASDAVAVLQRRLRRADARSRCRRRAAGLRHVAFGDLFLEDVRRYREDRLAARDCSRSFLSGAPTAALAREMNAAGLGRDDVRGSARRRRRLAGRAWDASSSRRCPTAWIRAASAASSTPRARRTGVLGAVGAVWARSWSATGSCSRIWSWGPRLMRSSREVERIELHTPRRINNLRLS